MKDLHIKLDNGEAMMLEVIKIVTKNALEVNFEDLSCISYNDITTTDVISSALELIYNCVANPESKTFNEPEDAFVRNAFIQAMYNRF